MHRRITTASVFGILALGALQGCSGHGKYTSEGLSLAEERMSLMKSATEWDLARQAFLGGDLDKALSKVDASISINDTVVKSHVLRGRILLEMGDLSNSIDALETARELDETDPDPHYYLGVVYERLTKSERALEHFSKAFELDDSSPEYAVAAAEMMIDLGRTSEASSYLGAIPGAENHAGIRQTLGQIALIEQDPARAEKHLRDARLLAPEDTQILEQLIHAQMLNAHYRDAQRLISEMLEDPEHASRRDLRILHARALMGTGDALRARSIFQSLVATERGDSDLESWVGLGRASLAVRDTRTARRAASRVIALAPWSEGGYVLWAMIHRREGDLPRSLDAIDDAIGRDGGDPELHAFRAVVLGELGRREDALLSAHHAAALDPSDATIAALAQRLRHGSLVSAPGAQN